VEVGALSIIRIRRFGAREESSKAAPGGRARAHNHDVEFFHTGRQYTEYGGAGEPGVRTGR
jgi:hypothetical protein